MSAGGFVQLLHPLQRDVHGRGDLLLRGFHSRTRDQFPADAAETAHLLGHVHGQPDGADCSARPRWMACRIHQVA